jgi:hypothetical protein
MKATITTLHKYASSMRTISRCQNSRSVVGTSQLTVVKSELLDQYHPRIHPYGHTDRADNECDTRYNDQNVCVWRLIRVAFDAFWGIRRVEDAIVE